MLATTNVTPFATLSGAVTSTNQPSQVVLHLNPGELRSDRAPTVVLGFYVEPVAGSSVSPEITQVTGPNGRIAPVSIPARGTTAGDKLARQSHLFTRVIPLATQSQDITLNVSTLNKKTGNYIVEAYLAGDVTGDGTVDATDVAALQVAYGSQMGHPNYTAAADFNGDGRVGCIDQKLTLLNLGAHVVGTASASVAVAPVASVTAVAPTTSSGEVNLVVPIAATTTPAASIAVTSTTPLSTTVAPIAVATPVSLVTPTITTTGTQTYVPVTLTPSSAIPVASTSTSAPVVLTPTYPSVNGVGTTTGTTTNPVYVLAQPPTATGTSTGAPIYVYGQPVLTGTSVPAATPTTVASSPNVTLFGPTTTGQPVGTATPVPVYLYNSSSAVNA